MRVLILGGRAPVALDHARRFQAHGDTVYVADSVPCRISSYGRSVTAAFRIPPPRFAPRQFADALAGIVTEIGIDLLLPTCEEIFYVSRFRDRLPGTCKVFAPPFDLLRRLHSKWNFLELAAGCGAVIPASARVAGIGEAREWSQGRAVVLKPEFSRFGVHVRLYEHGIPADAAPLPPLNDWVVQSLRTGVEYCSYSVAVNGQLTAHAEYLPRYRLAGSSSFYFDPVCIPGIEDFVKNFVRKIGYTGQVGFDWMVGSDGSCAVLECNPRAISGVHLFDVDDGLPAAIVDEAGICVRPRRSKARMFAPIMLSAGLRTALLANELHRWWVDWRRATDVLSQGGEMAPTWGAMADLASHALRARFDKCSIREASTRDIEWDGEELPV